MNRAVLREIGTHFTEDPTQNGKIFIAFHMDECSHCGRPLQGANAIGVHETKKRLEGFGMIYMETLPDTFYDFIEGDAVCYECYESHQKSIGKDVE